jgi:hypothetical protein
MGRPTGMRAGGWEDILKGEPLVASPSCVPDRRGLHKAKSTRRVKLRQPIRMRDRQADGRRAFARVVPRECTQPVHTPHNLTGLPTSEETAAQPSATIPRLRETRLFTTAPRNFLSERHPECPHRVARGRSRRSESGPGRVRRRRSRHEDRAMRKPPPRPRRAPRRMTPRVRDRVGNPGRFHPLTEARYARLNGPSRWPQRSA